MTDMSTTHSTTVPRRLRLAAVIASVLAASGILAGCSAGSYYETGAAAPAQDYAHEGDMGAADGATDPAKYSPEDRAVIITGSIYMTVEQPIEAADKVVGIVQAAGGRIDARRETAPSEGYGGAASMTLRIPAGQLESVVDRLRELGEIDEYSTDASDVTNEVRDLDARISTLRASISRIEGLIVDAKDISDIIYLEDELARRQADLESLEARQRGLKDQVSMSTIYLSLTTEPVVIIVDDGPQNFLEGLETGWNGLTAFVQSGLVVLGVLLPWLALLAILTFGIIAIVRASLSAKARQAASTPAVEPAPQAVKAPAAKK